MKQTITKRECAAILGVSPSTFDRARKRLGLRPVPSVQVKPIKFLLSDVAKLLPFESRRKRLVSLLTLQRAKRTRNGGAR